MAAEPVNRSGGGGIRGWRFPVRYRLPGKKDLAAYGLMALAFGLMVGIAIGPALSTVSSAAQVIAGAAPTTTAPVSKPPDSGPGIELGSPAGAGQSGAVSDPAPAVDPAPTPVSSPVPAAAPVSVPEGDPGIYAGDESDDATGDDVPDEGDTASTLTGVVTGVTESGTSYAVADPAGNLLAIHAGNPPEVGARVAVGILPLLNGTFHQPLKAKSAGKAKKTTVRGVVTWIDPAAGRMVLSARGVSLGLDLSTVPGFSGPDAPGAGLPEGLKLGSYVTAEARVGPAAEEALGDADEANDAAGESEPGGTPPRMGAVSIEVLSADPSPLELNGSILAIDRTAGTVSLAADSFGEVDDSIEVKLPAGFDRKPMRKGRIYSVAAKVLRGGTIRATGIWSNGNRQEAGREALLEP